MDRPAGRHDRVREAAGLAELRRVDDSVGTHGLVAAPTIPGPRRRGATILDIEVRSNVRYSRAERVVATDSPYWNPKTETLDRERIEALQLAKLRRQCEWAAARSPWYQRQFAAERFGPAQLRTLDDLRRIPVLTRDDWMASQEAKPPYGEIPTVGGRGGDPHPHDVRHDRARAAARARLAQGLGVDRRDVVLRDLGLRRAVRRHRLHRVRVRLVHRLLGPALRDGEDRRAERARRRPDDRGAGPPDRRLRRHGRRVHADVRAPAGAGGGGPRDRPARLGGVAG